jgi:hypothetical protein
MIKFLFIIIDSILNLLSYKESITIGELHNISNSYPVKIYDENNKLKFISELKFNNVLTEGQYGLTPIVASRKTIPYNEYEVILSSGDKIICADKHIFVCNNIQRTLDSLRIGDNLSVSGNKEYDIVSINDLHNKSNMYDLEIGSIDHTYYTNNILSHNSTTVAAGFILHEVLFGEYNKWGILANKASTAREILSRVKMAFEFIPLWLKPGVEEWNKGKISFDNGCSVLAESTSSDSIRGSALSGMLLDEFAHIENANDFYTSVMPVISSGINTKLIIVSTPNGKGNMYHKIWVNSISGKNGFVPYKADWRVVPERTEEWKQSQLADIGETRFKQEYECSFSASENTLIDLEILENIPTSSPKDILSEHSLYIFHGPKENRTYFISVDPARGLGLDYSAFHIIDITDMPFKQVGRYRSNSIDPLFLPNIIVNTAKKYNNAYVLMELNKGLDIAKDIYYENEYPHLLLVGKDRQSNKQKLGAWKDAKLGLLQSNAAKLKGCRNLKSLIENHKLELHDDETINELFTFVKTKESYAADKGKYDDLVMSLVIFAWASTEQYFKELTNQDFVASLKLENLTEDILPFGFITDYINEEYDENHHIKNNSDKLNNYI